MKLGIPTKKSNLIPTLSLLMIMILILTGTGCSKKVVADGDDLMKDITPGTVSKIDAYNEEDTLKAMNFSLELFKKNESAKNTLVSPISVLTALSMTANGAKENTRKQMEEVFGLSPDTLNQLLNLYIRKLPDEKKLKVSMANSIWFRKGGRIEVLPDFLQTNANYYGAKIYRSAFDQSTLAAINDWVDIETDGMIKDILDEIPDEAVMYLINALSFEAEWEKIYAENEISVGEFTAEDGMKQNVDMMFGEETRYLKDTNATGFIKNYAEGSFAFVALLPDEGTSVSEYLQSLIGESLQNLMKNAENTTVFTMMPKFKSEYSVEMSEILKEMGMSDAFDENLADLSGIGTSPEGNLFISRVIHKTAIEVNEKGTKAGAATVVEIETKSAAMETYSVKLDRPFVYLIIDTESYLPLFIGTTMSVE